MIKILVTVLAAGVILYVLASLGRPKRVLQIYAFTRPIVQPFILLQYKVAGVPLSFLWAIILPMAYAVGYLGGKWRLVCYKSTPFALLLGIAALSIPFSINVQASIEGWIKLLSGFLAFSMAYNLVNGRERANDIIFAIVMASVLPILFGFYQQLTGNFSQIHVAVVQRVNSVFGVGNAYGIFLAITICAGFMAVFRRDLTRLQRYLVLGALAGMFASQVLALNRGTWLALTCAIALALVPYRQKIKVRWFVIGALAIAVVFSGTIYKRMTEVQYRYDGQVKNTLQGRVDHWQTLLPAIGHRPLLGYGVGTTEARDKESHDTRVAPHNDYIRLAMDIGVIGSFLYLYFLASLGLFYLTRRGASKRELWQYNFPMTVLTAYFVVISATQNIVYNFTNFGFFMILNGVVIKLNVLTASKSAPRSLMQGKSTDG